MSLTKADLAETLLEKVGLNQREFKETVEAFFKVISDCLERGEEMKLAGSEDSACAICSSAQVAIQRLVSKFRFRPAG